jgi:precorrin-4 methylase
MHLDEIIEEMKTAHAAGQDVARVHSGDPAIYGAVAEQMRGSMRWGSTTRWCRACRPLPERRRSSRPN